MLVELTAVTGLTCLLSGFHRLENQQACERERERSVLHPLPSLKSDGCARVCEP